MISGYRILSINISMKNMVYEDALTVLSYASPYPVVLTLRKAAPLLSSEDGDATGMTGLNHPIYRSQSLDDLRKITRADRASGPRKTWTQIRRREKKESRAEEIGKLREWSTTRAPASGEDDDDMTDAPAQLEVDAPVEKRVMAEVMEAETQAQVEREVSMSHFPTDDVTTPHPPLPDSLPPEDDVMSSSEQQDLNAETISVEVHRSPSPAAHDLANDLELLQPIQVGDLQLEPPQEFSMSGLQSETRQEEGRVSDAEAEEEAAVITNGLPGEVTPPEVNESSFPEINTTLDLDLSTQANVTGLSHVDNRLLDLEISEISKPISADFVVTSEREENETRDADEATQQLPHDDAKPPAADVTATPLDDVTGSSAHDDAVRDVLKEFLGDDPSLLASLGIDTSHDFNDNKLKHVTAVDDVRFENSDAAVHAASERAAEQLRAAQEEMNGK